MLDAVSLMAYGFGRHSDVCAGAMYATLADGCASGHPSTSMADPIAGIRYGF